MYLNRIYKRIILLLVFSVLLVTVSCNIKQGTLGAQNRIFVFADSVFWQQVGDSVRSAFETEIQTPRTELNYSITWNSLDQLNSLNDRMNIFLIGQIDGEGPTDKYLKKYLPQELLQGIKDGRSFYFFNDDMFARDQIGLVMMANNVGDFIKNLKAQKEDIYKSFDQKYYARLKKTMFERDNNAKIEDLIAKNFGWKIDLQLDYFIATQDIKGKYIWLRRIQPNRWLSIWEADEDDTVLNLDSMIVTRNRMTKDHYQGDIVVEKDTFLQNTTLNGNPALKMVGVWRNDSLMVGGPFRTYAMIDRDRHKTYYLDIAVMAPEKAKKPYLDQLEVIANTFEVIDN